MGGSGRKAVACIITAGDFGINGSIGRKIASWYADSVVVAVVYCTGIGVAVDGQRDGITRCGIAANRTGHIDVLSGLSCVDDIVRGDIIDSNGGTRCGIDRSEICGSGSVARTVCDIGIDSVVAIRQCIGNVHTIVAVGIDSGGKDLCIVILISHFQVDSRPLRRIGMPCDCRRVVTAVVRRIDTQGRCGSIDGRTVTR